MATIILVLFLTAGVLAQHQLPLGLARSFRGESSDIPLRNPSDLVRDISVETYQDDNDITSNPLLGSDPMAVKLEVKTSNEDTENRDSGCVFPFVSISNHCYFFSEEQKTFADAEAYCETLEYGHSYGVSLAMMGYGTEEDQALMLAATERDNTFWIGGTTLDEVNWKWIDDRPLSLQLPLWYWGKPDGGGDKCLTTQVSVSDNLVRSYIHDSSCSESYNFICQLNFPDQIFVFRKIGNDYYFLSEEVGLPHATWNHARDYCRGLLVPVGYYADMAVLSMEQQDDYTLMTNLFPANPASDNWAWIGAVSENSDCNYAYIDNRTLSTSSSYWIHSKPGCGSEKFVALRYLINYNRVYLYSYTEASAYAFICQMYKTP